LAPLAVPICTRAAIHLIGRAVSLRINDQPIAWSILGAIRGQVVARNLTAIAHLAYTYRVHGVQLSITYTVPSQHLSDTYTTPSQYPVSD
jgi:hypothetical protein